MMIVQGSLRVKTWSVPMETAVLELSLWAGQYAVVLIQVAHLNVEVIDRCIDLVSGRIALHIGHLGHHFLLLDHYLLLLLKLAVYFRRDEVDARIDNI